MPKLSFQYVRQGPPETLLEFLSRRFKYHPPETWTDLVLRGLVQVNGKQVLPHHVLETRHKIVYDRPPFPEPPVDTAYRVLYEDEQLLAIEKSGNIPTSPSGKYWANCLVHHLQKDRSQPELRAVHRLDRETSGVNLFAKGRAIARQLGAAFHDGKVNKTYAAVVLGRPSFTHAWVSAPLGEDPRGTVRIRQAVRPDGRPAQTRFAVKALLEGAALVEAEPVTGRTHQIRAHAHWLGHPVWGDKLYGPPEEKFLAWVGEGARNSTQRQLLHAVSLTLLHPTRGTPLTIHSSAAFLLQALQRPQSA